VLSAVPGFDKLLAGDGDFRAIHLYTFLFIIFNDKNRRRSA
jgi:hypothetical protein